MRFTVSTYNFALIILLHFSFQGLERATADPPAFAVASPVSVEKPSLAIAQASGLEDSEALSAVTRLARRLEDLQRQLAETRQTMQEVDQQRLKAERERDQLLSERTALEGERQQLLEQQRRQEQEFQQKLTEARQAGKEVDQQRLRVERERDELEQQLVAAREAIEAERLSKAATNPLQGVEMGRPAGAAEHDQPIAPAIEEARSRQEQKSPQPARKIVGKDGARLVLVPAGEFTMGSDVRENEKPRHQVLLDAYYMNINEVTTSRYAGFMVATGRPEPDYWKALNLPRHGERPVVGVTWEDAKAYCRWAGGRLPTEAQWEKAARGTDGRFYPWGDGEPTFQHANFGKATWSGYDTLEPVGKLEAGQSPYGIHDLAGNVWEWIADWYDPGYYRQSPSNNPTGPSTGTTKGIRGGSWDLQAHFLRSANRSGAVPTTRHYSIGFRCVQDAK